MRHVWRVPVSEAGAWRAGVTRHRHRDTALDNRSRGSDLWIGLDDESHEEHYPDMPIGAPKSISTCKRFFREPSSPKQRQYEALRAYFAEERPSAEAARAFGYTPGSFHVMCHRFRREQAPSFFVTPRPGPRAQPKKSAARDLIIELRKRNHSVYEISEILKSRDRGLSPTAVREVLKAEGFAPLPRRLDEDRPDRPRPTIAAAADVRQLPLIRWCQRRYW